MIRISQKINPDKLKSSLLSIASLFDTERVERMRDIAPIYPTGIIKALGMNYGGYISKCHFPERFVVEDIIKLAHLLKIDPEVIMKIVLKEARVNVIPRNTDHLTQPDALR